MTDRCCCKGLWTFRLNVLKEGKEKIEKETAFCHFDLNGINIFHHNAHAADM